MLCYRLIYPDYMRNWLHHLRPNVLLICLMLLLVCFIGKPEIGLVAVGALAAVAKEIIDSGKPPQA